MKNLEKLKVYAKHGKITRWEFLKMLEKIRRHKIKEDFTWWFRKWYELYQSSNFWVELNDRVREKCKNICEYCNLDPFEVVHHLNYNTVGNEDMKDVQGVCNGCHGKIHCKKPKEKIDLQKLGDYLREISK